jgi:PAS domain S-box-containing protein
MQLFDLAAAVSRAQEPNETYQTAVQGIVRAVACDRAAVLSFDSDSVLRFNASIGLSDEYRAVVVGNAPWRRSARDVEPIVVADAMREPSLSAYHPAWARESIGAVAFIPLLANGCLIGRFTLYYNRPHQFQAEEIQVAQKIAGHVAFETKRQRAERTLRSSEERFRLIFHQAAAGIAQSSLDGNWLLANGRFCEILGYTQAELQEKTFLDVTHPDDRMKCLAARRQLVAGEIPSWSAEKRYIRKDGATVWARLYASLVRDANSRPQYFIGVIEDITGKIQAERAFRESERRATPAQGADRPGAGMAGADLDLAARKQAEAAQLEREECFRNVADGAPVLIWLSDAAGNITFCNRQVLTFTGRTEEELTGEGFLPTVHPDDLANVRSSVSAAVQGQGGFEIELRLRRADGEYRCMFTTGTPRFAGNQFVGLITSTVDITELKRNQDNMLAAQKLESLGQMVSGIAHIFNNLLGGILASAEVVLMESGQGSLAVEELRRITTAAIRGGEIVRQLMLSSEEPSQTFELVDISRLVGEMLPLVQVSISKRAKLQVNLPAKPPLCRANAAQLRQVVWNLITNASEALGEKEGVISVNVTPVRSHPDNPAENPRREDYLRLEVADTGCGMTEKIQSKIFDAFFTTKFPGRGLGLAAVAGIVRSHGGTISVVSAPGRGSWFEILLPCSSEPAFPGGSEGSV